MKEHIKDYLLGEEITLPIDFVVKSLETNVGYIKYDSMKLINEQLGINIYLSDDQYEELIKEVQNGGSVKSE